MVSFLLELSARLAENGIPDARFEAQCLTEHITGDRFTPPSPAQAEEIRTLAQRRIAGEPLQYLLGEWEFYGMRLFVGEGVLIPRPDTETLIDAVKERLADKPPHCILDLCTGSGCIALALQKLFPAAEVHAVDLYDTALTYARRNCALHGLPVKLHKGDVLDAALCCTLPEADMIVSNPPYITDAEMRTLQREVRREPETALRGGKDGLLFYRKMIPLWKQKLRPGGMLAFEIGETQGKAAANIFREHAFQNIEILPDLAGNDRIVLGTCGKYEGGITDGKSQNHQNKGKEACDVSGTDHEGREESSP